MSGLKLLVKLAIAALVANACWQLGSAYMRFYRFKDAVHETALFGAARSEADLQERVLELASQHDVPVTADDFTVRREDDHTFIDGSITDSVQVAPGYAYPLKFEWHIETFAAKPLRPSGVVR